MCSTCGCKDAESFDAETWGVQIYDTDLTLADVKKMLKDAGIKIKGSVKTVGNGYGYYFKFDSSHQSKFETAFRNYGKAGNYEYEAESFDAEDCGWCGDKIVGGGTREGEKVCSACVVAYDKENNRGSPCVVCGETTEMGAYSYGKGEWVSICSKDCELDYDDYEAERYGAEETKCSSCGEMKVNPFGDLLPPYCVNLKCPDYVVEDSEWWGSAESFDAEVKDRHPTLSKKAKSEYVFPERKAYPIGDEKHAMLALVYSTWPNNKKDASEVRRKVFQRYPQLRTEFMDGKYETRNAESFDAEVYAIEDGGKTELSFQELFDYLNGAIDNEYFLTKRERDDYYEKYYKEYEAESFDADWDNAPYGSWDEAWSDEISFPMGEKPEKLWLKNLSVIAVLAGAIWVGKQTRK